MAAIEVGTINFSKVYSGDEFDVTFDIEGLNLTGKTLFMQVRETADAEPVLEFSEDDSTLTKTVVSTTKTTVTLYHTCEAMKVPSLGAGKKYNHNIAMYTDDSTIDDKVNIVKGTFEIIDSYAEHE